VVPLDKGSGEAPASGILRVLVVDDDSGHVALALRRLSRLGFSCAAAATGIEALARLESGERFDAVVLDMNMPGLDGLATLARIRARPNPPPVVFVTGADEASLAVSGLKAGASDFIVKVPDPAYFDLLAAALRQAVSAEEERRARQKAEAARDLLTRELSHRVKNILSVVASIASLSGRSAESLESFLKDFAGRIAALSAAHDELVHEGWRHTNLAAMVEAVLAPQTSRRLEIDLPPAHIDPHMAHTLALVLHELATNAVKYGALASEGGSVRLTGTIERGEAGAEAVAMEWREEGPAPIERPQRRGFGLTMIERAMGQSGGRVTVEWLPNGLVCSLRLPLARPDEAEDGAALKRTA